MPRAAASPSPEAPVPPAPEADVPEAGGSTLTVAAVAPAPRAWTALIAPLAGAAAVLGLIAVGFATRRNLARVD